MFFESDSATNAKNKITVRYTQLDEEIPKSEPELSGLMFHDGGMVGTTSKRPAGGNGGAQISISRFSTKELHEAKHDDELISSKNKNIHLNIDTAHMGVGGDTGWTPETHLPYRVLAETGTVWKYKLEIEIA